MSNALNSTGVDGSDMSAMRRLAIVSPAASVFPLTMNTRSPEANIPEGKKPGMSRPPTPAGLEGSDTSTISNPPRNPSAGVACIPKRKARS